MASEVSFPTSNRERSTSLFRIEDRGFQTPNREVMIFRLQPVNAAHIQAASYYPKNIWERPQLEYQTLKSEGLLRLLGA